MRTIHGTTWSVEDAQAYIKARVKVDDNGCWIWRLSSFADGYGMAGTRQIATEKQRTIKAHKLAYEAFVGVIPAGMCVCHRCDVRSCVNPDHLWLGTNADNLRDMKSKGRHGHGEAHGMSKLTEAQVREIRARYAAGGVLQRELAAEFGVHQRHISKIVHGLSWRHI